MFFLPNNGHSIKLSCRPNNQFLCATKAKWVTNGSFYYTMMEKSHDGTFNTMVRINNRKRTAIRQIFKTTPYINKELYFQAYCLLYSKK